MCFHTKPDTIWIPIGLKMQVWFGNTLNFPSQTTSGFLLADESKVWFGNLLSYPSHLTMVHGLFAKLHSDKLHGKLENLHSCKEPKYCDLYRKFA